MNIYFSCFVSGGRRDQGIYRAIVDHLQASGHSIPTAEPEAWNPVLKLSSNDQRAAE